MPRGDHVLNFSDAEDLLDDEDVRDLPDEALEQGKVMKISETFQMNLSKKTVEQK